MAILAFDLTSSRSLQKLQEVFIPLLEDSVDSCLAVVVGTKLDLVSTKGRQVKSSEGRELAESQHDILLERALKTNPDSYLKNVQGRKLYFETSAKSGEGVTELFDCIQSIILPQLEKASSASHKATGKGRNPQERSIRLDANDSVGQPSKCCGGRN